MGVFLPSLGPFGYFLLCFALSSWATGYTSKQSIRLQLSIHFSQQCLYGAYEDDTSGLWFGIQHACFSLYFLIKIIFKALKQGLWQESRGLNLANIIQLILMAQ